MKPYSYNGKIVTAESRNEAIRVFAKIYETKQEKFKKMKKEWMKKLKDIVNALKSLFGNDYNINTFGYQSSNALNMDIIDKKSSDPFDIKTMPLSRAVPDFYITVYPKDRNIYNIIEDELFRISYYKDGVFFIPMKRRKEMPLKDVANYIKSSTRIKTTAKLAKALCDGLAKYKDKEDKSPLVPLIEQYFKHIYYGKEDAIKSKIDSVKRNLGLRISDKNVKISGFKQFCKLVLDNWDKGEMETEFERKIRRQFKNLWKEKFEEAAKEEWEELEYYHLGKNLYPEEEFLSSVRTIVKNLHNESNYGDLRDAVEEDIRKHEDDEDYDY